jgi:AraC-like DNA-binding protein
VKFWRAHDVGDLDLLRATYITHAFARHTHAGYAIGLIECGAETFWYRGAQYVAPAGSIVLINPDEVHTGEAVDATGWSYRMLYPEVDLVRRAAEQLWKRKPGTPRFPRPVVVDPEALSSLRSLHVTLEESASTLERESRLLATILTLLSRHATAPSLAYEPAREPGAVERVRRYLHEHYAENPSLSDLAALAGLSPYHLLRVFRRTTQLPPHAYLTQVRVAQARTLLAAGLPAVRVAMETGFTDQSHLTRHFKRAFGVTPGQYARGGTG